MTIPIDTRDLAASIRSVLGVTELFPPPGAIAWLSDLTNGSAPFVVDDAKRLAVTTGPNGTSITARIGVTHALSTPETARHAADALLTAAPGSTVTVQVTRIT